jgi:hypothetical protein
MQECQRFISVLANDGILGDLPQASTPQEKGFLEFNLVLQKQLLKSRFEIYIILCTMCTVVLFLFGLYTPGILFIVLCFFLFAVPASKKLRRFDVYLTSLK